MMQETKTIGAPDEGLHNVSKRGFAVLLALARKPLSYSEVGDALGITTREREKLLERFHRQNLIEEVSELRGNRVKRTLRLTDEGQAALLRAMQQMCELPEL